MEGRIRDGIENGEYRSDKVKKSRDGQETERIKDRQLGWN